MSIVLSNAQAQAIRQAIGGCTITITMEGHTDTIRKANLTGAQMDAVLDTIDAEIESARSTIFDILEEASHAS